MRLRLEWLFAAFFLASVVLTGCSYFDVGRSSLPEEALPEIERLTPEPEEQARPSGTPPGSSPEPSTPPEGVRTLTGTVETTTRSVSLDEAEGLLSQLWEPRFLPEGYVLRTALLEERSTPWVGSWERNLTLTYAPPGEWWPWIVVQQPGCTLPPLDGVPGSALPTDGRTLQALFMQEPVMVGGNLGWLVGRPEPSRTIAITLGNVCVKAPKDAGLMLETVFQVVERLRPRKPELLSTCVDRARTFLGAMMMQQGDAVMVVGIVRGTGAEKAGLQTRDVILAIDGTKIRASDDVLDALRDRMPREVVRLTVRRGSQEIAIDVELTERPVSTRPLWPQPGPEMVVPVVAPIESGEEAISAVANELRSPQTPDLLFSTWSQRTACSTERFTEVLKPWTWWPGEPLPPEEPAWQAERLDAGTWPVILVLRVPASVLSQTYNERPTFGVALESSPAPLVPVVHRWLVEVESGRVLWPMPYDCVP